MDEFMKKWGALPPLLNAEQLARLKKFASSELDRDVLLLYTEASEINPTVG